MTTTLEPLDLTLTSRRRPLAVVAIALVAAAMAWAGIVVVQSDGSTEVEVRSGNGEVAVSARAAVASTVFESRGRRVEVAGAWQPIVADWSGDRVAAVAPLGEGATIYAPGGRTASEITVVDFASGSAESLTLAGNVLPEAFGAEELGGLFVIDHRPAVDPEAYRVQYLPDDGAEAVDVYGPNKKPLDEDMRGIGRQQVWHPEGDYLFTLYTRQPDEGDVGVLRGFVHVLDVRSGWATCLELPVGFGTGPAGTASIAIADDGSEVTVDDTNIGQRAVFDLSLLDVDALATTPEPGPTRIEEL